MTGTGVVTGSNGLPAGWGGGKAGLGSARTYVPPTPPKLAAHLRPVPTGRELEARKAARALVSQTFYGPMLKQMRDSPFKDDLFSGGRGGQAFTALLDQQLAVRMGRDNDPLVEAIARRAMRAEVPGARAAAPGARAAAAGGQVAGGQVAGVGLMEVLA